MKKRKPRLPKMVKVYVKKDSLYGRTYTTTKLKGSRPIFRNPKIKAYVGWDTDKHRFVVKSFIR